MFFSNNDKTEFRRRPTQRRSTEIFTSVVEATKHLIENKGYQHINTNMIAEYAGVSIGSLYQYFKTKASIVSILIESKIESHLDLLFKCSDENREKPLEEYLEALLNKVYDIFIEDRRTIRKYFLSEMLMLRYRAIMQSRKRMAHKMGEDLHFHFSSKPKEQFIKDIELAIHALMVVVHGVIWSEKNYMERELFVRDGVLLINSYL